MAEYFYKILNFQDSIVEAFALGIMTLSNRKIAETFKNRVAIYNLKQKIRQTDRQGYTILTY